MMWVGLTQTVQVLPRTKDWHPLSNREFCELGASDLNRNVGSSLVLQPDAHHIGFALVSLPNPMNQFFFWKNLSVRAHILLVLCLCGTYSWVSAKHGLEYSILIQLLSFPKAKAKGTHALSELFGNKHCLLATHVVRFQKATLSIPRW